MPNVQKSCWVPKTNITWLGYFWNFEDRIVSVSSSRTEKLTKRLLEFVKNSPMVSARSVAEIVGS